jgi:hypothetical protein
MGGGEAERVVFGGELVGRRRPEDSNAASTRATTRRRCATRCGAPRTQRGHAALSRRPLGAARRTHGRRGRTRGALRACFVKNLRRVDLVHELGTSADAINKRGKGPVRSGERPSRSGSTNTLRLRSITLGLQLVGNCPLPVERCQMIAYFAASYGAIRDELAYFVPQIDWQMNQLFLGSDRTRSTRCLRVQGSHRG